MVKKLITMLLLVLCGAQLSWPMATHLVSAHAPKDAAMAAGHNHSMAGRHDCCPQVEARFEIKAPASGPCDNQHRCCMGSREVPVVQASSTRSGPEVDWVTPCIEQSAPILRSSTKASHNFALPAYQASITVLRI
jgi:hypothetical protein